MWCESEFRELSNSINLNPARRDRINSALEHFERFCGNEPALSAAMGKNRPFVQGSVASGTSIRPIQSDEHDVDVVFPFSSRSGVVPAEPRRVVDWFLEHLEADGFYKDRITPKSRCVRINYAGDFHLDIVPACPDMPSHHPFAIPTKDAEQWVTTDPLGYTQWVAVLDMQSGDADDTGAGRFVRSLRILKRWRDLNLTPSISPPSILLSTMLGRHEPNCKFRQDLNESLFPKYPYMAAYLYDMLRLVDSCISEGSANAFRHPTLDEDLGKGWQHHHLSPFRDRLQECVRGLRSGIDATDKKGALESFRRALGEFPVSDP